MWAGVNYTRKKDLDYIPRTDLDVKFKDGNSEFEMKWVELIEGKTAIR